MQGLQNIGRSPGAGKHLQRAGLRQHGALMDAAVDSQDWPLAEAILQQVAPLQVSSSFFGYCTLGC